MRANVPNRMPMATTILGNGLRGDRRLRHDMQPMHDPDSTPQDSFDALLAQLDTGGRDFERLAGWFLVNDPEYAAIFERVWAWNDWPGCWGPDKGID